MDWLAIALQRKSNNKRKKESSDWYGIIANTYPPAIQTHCKYKSCHSNTQSHRRHFRVVLFIFFPSMVVALVVGCKLNNETFRLFDLVNMMEGRSITNRQRLVWENNSNNVKLGDCWRTIQHSSTTTRAMPKRQNYSNKMFRYDITSNACIRQFRLCMICCRWPE